MLHPFVEAQMSKSDVRPLARALGLGDLAELPAAPCLASRIETGLRVEPADLAVIDRVETLLREVMGNITLRCRRLRGGWVIEIDPLAYEDLSAQKRAAILTQVRQATDVGRAGDLRAYSRGSAFVHL